MRPDPVRIAESRPWFVRADHDLRAAGVLLAATPPLLGEAAYHCQQAAEKSLKGYLSWVEDAIALAREAFEAMLAKLPTEVRP